MPTTNNYYVVDFVNVDTNKMCRVFWTTVGTEFRIVPS